jgi:hypothetical protein
MRVSPQIPFILILIITAFIAIASSTHAMECLSSASAVWAAHPGSHATWRLQLPRSQDTLADTERAPLPFVEPASAGEAKSILMWGAPMRIDATWEELFAGRERRAE